MRLGVQEDLSEEVSFYLGQTGLERRAFYGAGPANAMNPVERHAWCSL